MKTQEQPETKSNLEALEADFSLTKKELDDFKKLPKEQKEKQKQEKLAKLSDLHKKLDQAIQEAIKTGELDEAEKLKEQLEKEIKDLEDQIEVNEHPELPGGLKIMEITPDIETTSAETAIEKIEAGGYKISHDAKDMFTKIDWYESLDDSYKVVSISVGELFGDEEEHAYTDIKNKARKIGLDLVPASLAPSIRLNYDRNGIWTNIAMNSINNRNGAPALFVCRTEDGGSWLFDLTGRDDYKWSDRTRFFFVHK